MVADPKNSITPSSAGAIQASIPGTCMIFSWEPACPLEPGYISTNVEIAEL
jgi:hypothetical protein